MVVRKAKPLQWFLDGVFLFALVCFVALLFGGGSMVRGWIYGYGLPRVQSPPPAVYSWQAIGLDGSPLPMDQFKGEVLLINVWATWCGPCVAEMPSLQRLHDALADEGLKVLALSSDESVAPVAEFVADRAFTLPVAMIGPTLPPVFATDVLPTTFVVARDGRVVSRLEGTHPWDHPDTIRDLRALLAESAS